MQNGIENRTVDRIGNKTEKKVIRREGNTAKSIANRIVNGIYTFLLLYEYELYHNMLLTDLSPMEPKFYYCEDQKVKYRTAKLEVPLH